MKAVLFIARYIKYFFTAKNKHSAQAPFLYEFITKVLNKNADDENCKRIEQLRKELCRSDQTIKITDFGAGSHINDSKTRKIKDVAKNSAKNSKFGKLLYQIVKYYKPKNILELGTSFGISTCYLAKANSGGKVFTFDGDILGILNGRYSEPPTKRGGRRESEAGWTREQQQDFYEGDGHDHGDGGSTPNGGVAVSDNYPLKTCLVSDEGLTSMQDEAFVHVHKGVTVKFCCEGCLDEFNEEPKKFLLKKNSPSGSIKRSH